MSEENNEVVEETPITKKSFKAKLAKKDEEIKTLQAEVNHWKNEYYRAYADTQNLRKALEKDHQEALKYRIEGFIDSLIPILDSFHMATENSPNNPEIANYVLGFKYIYRNLVNALEEEGVKEINPELGSKFDLLTMEAVESEESDEEENKVLKVYAKGYRLHDRLIRPARVLVSKKKTISNEDN